MKIGLGNPPGGLPARPGTAIRSLGGVNTRNGDSAKTTDFKDDLIRDFDILRKAKIIYSAFTNKGDGLKIVEKS